MGVASSELSPPIAKTEKNTERTSFRATALCLSYVLCAAMKPATSFVMSTSISTVREPAGQTLAHSVTKTRQQPIPLQQRLTKVKLNQRGIAAWQRRFYAMAEGSYWGMEGRGCVI
jgi:hypothetical protein